MPFTSKLRTEYVELVNHYLDNIPLETPEGFPVVSEALKAITEPNQSHHVPPSLEGRIKDLKDILEEPEMFVKDRANDQEFKNIILQRVSRKIEELDELGDAEKKRYIAFQKEQKKQAIENHADMAKHNPPEEGSPAHTDPVEEVWVLEQLVLPFSELSTNRQTRESNYPVISSTNINRREEGLMWIWLNGLTPLYYDESDTVSSILNNFERDLTQRITDAEHDQSDEIPSFLGEDIPSVTPEQLLNLMTRDLTQLILNSALSQPSEDPSHRGGFIFEGLAGWGGVTPILL